MRLFYVVTATLLATTAPLMARHKKTASVYLVEEKINGIPFSYRLDAVDGVKKEQWLFQGKPVSKEKYMQELAEATLDEERKERAAEYERIQHDCAFCESLQTTISKKLIATTIEQIEEALKKFDDYQLSEHLRFNTATVPNQAAFEAINGYHVAQARTMLANHHATSTDLQTMLTTLEQYPERLRLLWEHTITWAVDNCTDTRKLKKLLELIG